MINDEVIISVRGHEFPVSFPNVGQYYKIEAMKQSLSRGFYNSMVMSPANRAQHALDMIDIEATLTILCPQMIEDLKVKNFNELAIVDYKEIRDAYYAKVAPFFKEVNDLLNGKTAADVEGK